MRWTSGGNCTNKCLMVGIASLNAVGCDNCVDNREEITTYTVFSGQPTPI